MTSGDRPRKAAGTYGFLDVLLHPALMFSPQGPSRSNADIEAVRNGGSRIVSCFLRGSIQPFPPRLTQGTLTISASSATWKPYFRFPRRPLRLEPRAESVTTRPADSREPGVKKGGQAGVVTVPAFMVVTGHLQGGSADFVVPGADAPLVGAWLGGTLAAPARGERSG